MAQKARIDQFNMFTKCHEIAGKRASFYFGDPKDPKYTKASKYEFGAQHSVIEEICKFREDVTDYVMNHIVIESMKMESALPLGVINDKIIAHVCAYDGSTHTFLKEARKLRASRDAIINPNITCNHKDAINEFVLGQTLNETVKKDWASRHLRGKMTVWKDTYDIQPERFMKDLVKTIEMMSTIGRAYDLTTSQSAILFVEGLNKEIKKEMGRLMLAQNNTS